MPKDPEKIYVVEYIDQVTQTTRLLGACIGIVRALTIANRHYVDCVWVQPNDEDKHAPIIVFRETDASFYESMPDELILVGTPSRGNDTEDMYAIYEFAVQ